jgi:hypothetical protein
MTLDEELDQSLAKLREAISPHRSIVAQVMARAERGTMPLARSRTLARLWFTPSWRPRLAVSMILGTAALFVVGFLLFGERSSSAFATDAIAALTQAKAEGVTVKERIIAVMADGARHTSSTTSVLFVGKDSYRRDIYENDKLRESQWYTRKEDGMLQTSVRFDNKTYTQQTHQGAFGDKNPIERVSLLVKFIDRAERPLEALEISGVKCTGFEIRASKYGDNPADWVDRIWFNPVTKLPVRIEEERPRREKQFQALIAVQEQFDWHPALPADTFSPKIPDGFAVQK